MTLKQQQLIGIGLALLMVLTGCTQTTQTTQTAQTKQEDKSRNMKRADVMGQVKSIIGNSVTLDLAKVPTREMTANEGANGDAASGPPPTGMPSGASGGMPSQSTKARSTTLTLTGESKEIIIPVGVTITSGMGSSEKSIDLADIKVGSILRIYYAEGTTDIERVSVR